MNSPLNIALNTPLNIPVPVRRGAAVVAVAGGALALAGAGVSPPAPAAAPADAGAALQVAVPSPRSSVTLAAETVSGGGAPVAVSSGSAFSAAALVAAVRDAEEETRQRVDEHRAEARRLADEARREAEQRAAAEREKARAAAREKTRGTAPAAAPAARAATASADCALDTSGLGRVKPHVRDAAEFLGCASGEPTMHGVAGRAGKSDHPSGLAVDFMVDRATGDALADCALRNKEALGVTYVIWRQRINHGSAWKGMENRGSATANHMDHVHVSFAPGAGTGRPVAC